MDPVSSQEGVMTLISFVISATPSRLATSANLVSLWN
jgi:hypothetical protein